MEKRVIWAVPPEKAITEEAFRSFLNVAAHAGARGYARLDIPTQRVDVARNNLVRSFLAVTENDNDTLVMLDADHMHPADIISRLVAWNKGVVGALAFKRGAPYDPCWFIRGSDGLLHHPAEWDKDAKLIPCAIVGTGAIAIQRWVFKALDANGRGWPYFQCTYPDVEDIHKYTFPSEDMAFGLICEEAGIPHYVDATFDTPHLFHSVSDRVLWEQYRAENPAPVMEVIHAGV